MSHERHRRVASNLLIIEEAARAADALREAGVTALVLKGCAIAGDIVAMEERDVGDVDLLVRRGDWRRADAALKGLGATRFSPSLRVVAGRLHHAGAYVTPRGRSLDVHVALADPWRWSADIEGCFARAQRFSLAGREAYRLCAEDLVLHAAINQAKDDYYAAGAVARDVQAVVDRLEPSWETIVERAGAWRCRVALYTTLEYARRRRSVTVPESVLSALRPPLWRRRALDAVIDIDRPRPYRFDNHPRRLRQLLVAPLATDDPTYFPRRAAAHVLVGAVDGLLAPATVALRALSQRRASVTR